MTKLEELAIHWALARANLNSRRMLRRPSAEISAAAKDYDQAEMRLYAEAATAALHQVSTHHDQGEST